ERLDAYFLPGPAVESHESAVLQLRVNCVRILRIDAAVEAIAALGNEPIGVGDAMHAARPGRTAESEVVLRAAIDVVERPGFVRGDVVELRHRQVRLEM